MFPSILIAASTTQYQSHNNSTTQTQLITKLKSVPILNTELCELNIKQQQTRLYGTELLPDSLKTSFIAVTTIIILVTAC